MNGEETFLFIWVKSLAVYYNLIESPNIDNFNHFIFDYCLDDDFIFNFFKVHFDKKFVNMEDDFLNKFEIVIQNMMKYFEFFSFTPRMTKKLFVKKFYLKENKIKLWKIFLTITFLGEFSYNKYITIENKPLDDSVVSYATVYNLIHKSNKRLQLKFLIKSPFLLSSILHIVTEILNEMDETHSEFQTVLNKIFNENIDSHNESILDYGAISPLPTPRSSPAISPRRIRHTGKEKESLNISLIDLENFQTFQCQKCEELNKIKESNLQLGNEIEQAKATLQRKEEEMKNSADQLEYMRLEIAELLKKTKAHGKFENILKRTESNLHLQMEENVKLSNKLTEKDFLILKLNEEVNHIEDLKQIIEEYKIKCEKLSTEPKTEGRVSIQNLNIFNQMTEIYHSPKENCDELSTIKEKLKTTQVLLFYLISFIFFIFIIYISKC